MLERIPQLLGFPVHLIGLTAPPRAIERTTLPPITISLPAGSIPAENSPFKTADASVGLAPCVSAIGASETGVPQCLTKTNRPARWPIANLSLPRASN